MATRDDLSNHRDEKLDEALAMLAAGIPLENVLVDAGDDAQWLHPLLKIAAEVGELRQTFPIPPPETSLQRLLTYGEEMAPASPPPASTRGSGWLITVLNFFFSNGTRLAISLVTALLIVILVGGTLNLASKNSLPGQPLYSVKRAGENLRLSLARDPEQRKQLNETFNLRRQRETQLLLEQGKQATVVFEGYVESLTTTAVTIDGLVAQLTPETEVTGELAAKARVRLEGVTQPGGLVALVVTVIEPALPVATPTPTPTVTPSATATATLSPTATATATPAKSEASDTLNLPTPTATHSPTATPTSTPTITPMPPLVEPTPTDIPIDDSNDNMNDDTSADNDNSDDSNNQNDGNNDNDNNNDDNSNDNNDNSDDHHDDGNDNDDDHSDNDNDSDSDND
jgi:hypothetical protein